MLLTELNIQKFAVWRDVSIPLRAPGINVLYGPNEAGKTTLMRYVRQMIYGLRPESHEEMEGRLNFSHHGEGWTLHRHSGHGSTSVPTLTSFSGEHRQADWLKQLTGELSEPVFDAVYAVDLLELQELATLDHETLAERIYGLSLGREGRQLMEAAQKARKERLALISEDGQHGKLTDLLQRERVLKQRRANLPDGREEQLGLSAELDQLNASLSTNRNEQERLKRELRGRQFLGQVYDPWLQVKNYRDELALLKKIEALPESGLEQLDELNEEIEAITRDRDELREHAEQLKTRAEELGVDARIENNLGTVRCLVGMRDWIAEQEMTRDGAADESNTASEHAERLRGELQPKWSVNQLHSITESGELHRELGQAAKDYRDATTKLNNFQRRYRKFHERVGKKNDLLEQRLKDLDADAPEDALTDSRNKIAIWERLSELLQRESIWSQRAKTSRTQLDRLREELEIPEWMYWVFGIFTVGGGVFMLMGIIAAISSSLTENGTTIFGFSTNFFVGGIYLLLGLTCGALALKMKSHYELAIENALEDQQRTLQQEEATQRELKADIDQLLRSGNSQLLSITPDNRDDLLVLISEEHERAAELSRLPEVQQRVQLARVKLSELRQKLRGLQQQTDTERRRWCEALTRLGMRETLDIDEAYGHWHQVLDAAGAEQRRLQAADRYRQSAKTVKQFGTQLEQLGHVLQLWNVDRDRPSEALDRWAEQIARIEEKSVERHRLLDECKLTKQEISDCEIRLNELGQQRQAILTAAGVATRDEYESRVRHALQRREVEDYLTIAEAELKAAASIDPELAIVESDLEGFEAEENSEAIELINLELEELAEKLAAQSERRGEITAALDAIAIQHDHSELDYEISRVEFELRQLNDEYQAALLAEQTFDQQRQELERNYQPPVLAAASEYLSSMTSGRYQKLQAPFGGRALNVEIGDGKTIPVDQLSSGTREQVFLSLRMALVKTLADEGTELPLMLDDVFVNFDRQRTEAAVDTLLQFTAQGRQVLFFTCHQHLAELFGSRGVETTYLPQRELITEHRLAG
ncbi:AAA family ATPase [Calycomorphotria hydatis]|uniref:Rad50/SbcC-type AAA domain-containing protein n=1 Tax=Calycomorphotria hydatis TaxID=2528027 RepID=A0A517TBZ4_9PLAN|nr:AAA family ATPase [Calycomorphotria hydatis]QDT65897.1 hypothetical protein V22_31600 [Calycomorphotria hydatis]